MPALQSRRSASMARLALLAAPALLAALLSACQGDQTVAPRPNLSAGNGPTGNNGTVRVTPASDTLNALNQTVQLTANVAATWSSLTPTITTVDASGLVTAVSPGLGLIQALAKNHKADTAQVLVRQIVASVRVVPDSIVLTFFSDTLTAVVADSNGYPIANALVAWASDATAVATVSNGVVTPVDTGTTTIRATADDVTGTARVDVVPAPYP
jgi:hypothetical protein